MDFETKTTELLAGAAELVHKFGADAAVVIVSSDGKNIYMFSKPDLQTILDKSKETENPPTIHHFKPEVPVEIDLHKERVQMLEQTLMKVLDEDISSLNFGELIKFEKKLYDGMKFLKNRKEQILMGESFESRMMIQGFPPSFFLAPSTRSAAPTATNRGRGTAHNPRFQVCMYLVGTPANRRRGTARGVSLPQTSSAAPTATDNSQSNRGHSDEETDTTH